MTGAINLDTNLIAFIKGWHLSQLGFIDPCVNFDKAWSKVDTSQLHFNNDFPVDLTTMNKGCQSATSTLMKWDQRLTPQESWCQWLSCQIWWCVIKGWHLAASLQQWTSCLLNNHHQKLSADKLKLNLNLSTCAWCQFTVKHRYLIDCNGINLVSAFMPQTMTLVSTLTRPDQRLTPHNFTSTMISKIDTLANLVSMTLVSTLTRPDQRLTPQPTWCQWPLCQLRRCLIKGWHLAASLQQWSS